MLVTPRTDSIRRPFPICSKNAQYYWLPRRPAIVVLFAFTCILLVRCGQKNDGLHGTVSDENGVPIAGAAVFVEETGDFAVTDTSGVFELKDLIPKSYTLEVVKEGYESYSTSATLLPTDAKECHVTLTGGAVGEKLFAHRRQGIVSVPAGSKTLSFSVGQLDAFQPPSGYYSNFSGKNTDDFSYKSATPGLRVDGEAHDTITNEIKDDYVGESYDRIYENPFLNALDEPLSTFSIDVDAASYSNCRRFLNGGTLPPPDAVRIEEHINYFTYDYPEPKESEPFSITAEATNCPWNPQRHLALIGLKGKSIPADARPPSNLVFLIDVSGSMGTQNKLPLLQRAFRFLTTQLGAEDKVSIVVYAGAAGLALPPTSGSQKSSISNAINNLLAGGSTAGGAGIALAYKTAQEHFIKGGNNRVILATDGDFNVGVSSDGALTRLIEKQRASGIFLTVLGFGTGNYKDSKMEKLANKGNGAYAYIDTFNEAKKVFGQELGATLFTIAKDVKIQVEFNPARVATYRLIGYENRMLAARDFEDDTKDAGEIGAGAGVTALYEIELTEDCPAPETSKLKYQNTAIDPEALKSPELLTVKFRYKEPDGDTSKLIVRTLAQEAILPLELASHNILFASSVAEYGLLLRDSEHKGAASYASLRQRAERAQGNDAFGYRAEFMELAGKAAALYKSSAALQN